MSLLNEPRSLEFNDSFNNQRGLSVSVENVTYRNSTQPQQHLLNLNYDTTRSHSETNISHNNTNNNNMLTSSPLRLSNNLHNLSLHNIDSDPLLPYRGPYSLIIRNIPTNITTRECHLMFTFATNIISIDLVSNEMDHFIIAKFNSLQSVLSYASILNSKNGNCFGPTFQGICLVEIIDDSTNKKIPLNYNTKSNDKSTQQNYEIVPSSTVGFSPFNNKNDNAKNIDTNNFIQQKSRFSFNDPFNGEQSRMNSIQNQNQNTASINEKTNINANSQSGKSLLLMENSGDDDDIWKSNLLNSSNNSQFNDIPQPPTSSTPIINWSNTNQNTNSYNTAGTVDKTNNNNNNNNNNNTMINNPMLIQQQVPLNGNDLHLSHQQLQTSIPIHHDPNNNSVNVSFNQSSNIQTPLTNQLFSDQIKQQSVLNSTSFRNIPPSSSSSSTPIDSKMISTNDNTPTKVNRNSQSVMNQADLTLLAKIPPPANPADQNPPCNTLYVGNLPPDATEQELRQLFSNQQGFRRLSFKNKNPNSSHGAHHNHGPMCFVEFEDIGFATRALAELYGSQLPRPNVNNKGGIRLSFSKNPLGVRGPNNRKKY